MKPLFILLLTVLFGLVPPAPGRAANHPMNVLILYGDDWRHDSLGCAGNPIVETPNLDKLSKESVRFTHNCVTTAICGVSRASLFTGQWMSRHGNRGFNMFQTPWEETFPGLLRANGYHVGHVGKWHNKPFPADRYDFARIYSGTHWIKQDNGEKIHVTRKNEKDALEFLATRPSDKPFCLTVAFFAPHAEDGNPKQYLPQPESMKLYQDVAIPIPKTATDEAFHKLPPFIANEKNEGRVRWHWRFDTPEKYQEMMKNYYRLIGEVDATCGRLIAEMETRGLLDNTLIIFLGDNGYFHAEHGLADKWYPHQESIRVPLILRDPRLTSIKRGTTNDELTLNVDIAPTILGALGIKAPPGMQGRDLAALYLRVDQPAWRTEFFYEHPPAANGGIPPSEALVRKDWKYFYWPEHQIEQLFHITADPLEETDLAGDPAHAAKLSEMRTSFSELKAAAK